MKRGAEHATERQPVLESLEPRILLDALGERQVLELFSLSPALFVENQGQWADEAIRYVHEGGGASVAMTDAGIVFEVSRRGGGQPGGGEEDALWPRGRGDSLDPDISQVLQFSASFVGAGAVMPLGQERSGTVFNYFVGGQSAWRENVPAYEVVAYEGLYEGIDLRTWGVGSHLKYEFRVAPGADWSVIQVRYDGITGLSLAEDGSLVVDLGEGWGSLVDGAPCVYQEIAGEVVEVAGRFVLVDERTYAFEITGDYDPARELVIDPDLAWGIYSGEGWSVAADAAGNVLFSGGGVTKFSPEGEAIWFTRLGGTVLEIAVDADGNVLATGYTSSAGWASGGYDTTFGGWTDGFVVKLSPTGGLLWSTYLGGSAIDSGWGIVADADGSLLVAGDTRSPDWVSGGPDTTLNGSNDAFVVRLGPAGEHLWSTYLGGVNWDGGKGIALDAEGNILLAGETDSAGWVSGGYDTTFEGPSEGFAAKLSPGGDYLWSTYVGGSKVDRAEDIAVDAAGNALVAGWTTSSGWVEGGFDTTFNGIEDAFVVKLTPAGEHLWSTYLGGSASEYAWAIALDAGGNALVAGDTYSAGWVSGGFDTDFGGSADGFVAKLSASGGHLWSAYLGGSDLEYAWDVAVDDLGNTLVTGGTQSSDWIPGAEPVPNAFGFLVKIHAEFALAGRVTYKAQDGTTRDAAYVWVEAWEAEADGQDYELAHGYTDAAGRFAFIRDVNGQLLVNEDTQGPSESGTRDIYFKVRAMNEAAQVSPTLTGGILGTVYSYDSDAEYDVSGPVYGRDFHFVATDATPDHAAAWGLPGEVKSHRDWLLGVTDPAYARGSVDVLFPDTDWPETGWTSLWWGDVIRIPEQWDGTTWEESPQAVAHEYGHAVHWELRGQDWPVNSDPPTGEEDPKDGTPEAGQGGHWIYSESSPGFALVEGWAEFFECARYADESLLGLETNDYWMGADRFDPAGEHNNRDGTAGHVVEGAVAGILWDLWDAGPGDDDGVAGRWADVWTVFREDLPDSIWDPAGGDDFYHYWNARFGQTRAVDEIFIDHGIPVADDDYEDNDSPDEAGVLSDGTAEYPDLICLDEDWYRFAIDGVSFPSSEVRIVFDGSRGALTMTAYDGSLSPVGGAPERTLDGRMVTLALSLGGLPSGTYYLRVQGEGSDGDDGDGIYEGDTSPNYSVILSVGAPPTARDDSYSLDEDSAATYLAVLANDDDPDPTDVLTIVQKTDGAHGAVAVVGGGTGLTYTPAGDFYGVDVFTYTVDDRHGNADTAAVTVHVANVNDDPRAVDDYFFVGADSGANPLPVLANDTWLPDPPETLSIVATTDGTLGTVAITGEGTGLTYTPDPRYGGRDSFTYTISDGNGGTATATVSLIVEGIPSIGYVAEFVGDGLYGFTFTVYANDAYTLSFFANATFTGADGGVIEQVNPMGMPAFAVDSESIADAWDGMGGYVKARDSWFGDPFAKSPPADILDLTGNQPGDAAYHIEAGTGIVSGYSSAKLAYIACTGNVEYTTIIARTGLNHPLSGTAQVPPNTPPTADDDAAEVFEDSEGNVLDVLVNDGDPDAGQSLRVIAVGPAGYGTSSLVDGQVLYTPDPAYYGPDAFTYTVADGYGGTDTAIVGVTVRAVSPICGDANGDGTVDQADYTVWADHYGQPGEWSEGDSNGDGLVDGADYTLWADNCGSVCGGSRASGVAITAEASAPRGGNGDVQVGIAGPLLVAGTLPGDAWIPVAEAALAGEPSGGGPSAPLSPWDRNAFGHLRPEAPAFLPTTIGPSLFRPTLICDVDLLAATGLPAPRAAEPLPLPGRLVGTATVRPRKAMALRPLVDILRDGHLPLAGPAF